LRKRKWQKITSLTSALFLLAPFMQGATVSLAIIMPLAALCRLPLSTVLSVPAPIDDAAGRMALLDGELRTECKRDWWFDTGVRELDMDFIVFARDGLDVRILLATACEKGCQFVSVTDTMILID
jgi:hypothetical protein